MSDFDVTLEFVAILMVVYVLISLLISGIGAQRTCGSFKAFLVSILLTPISGFVYVLTRPHKSVLKTVHYRCGHCGLEYTSSHQYCHICSKEGHKYRLRKISMKTY